MVNLTCFKLYHLYGNSTNGRSDLFALFLLYITNTKPAVSARGEAEEHQTG